MKKVVLSLLTIISAICMTFSLTACDISEIIGGSGDSECEHVFSDWERVEEPNCVSIGYGVRECEECGIEEQEFYSALGHNWGEGHVLQYPDCATKGLMLYSCQTCRTAKLDEFSIRPEDDPKHEISIIVLKEPTCTEDGLIHYVCEKCDMIMMVETPQKLGHNFVDKMCSVCHLHLYTITVEYKFEDGSLASDNVTVDVVENDNYSISVPEIEGYIPSKTIISGKAESDVFMTVVYSPLEMQVVESINNIDLGNVEYNTEFNNLAMPSTVIGITDDGAEVELTVIWDANSYSKTTYGAQQIVGVVVGKYGYVLDCSNVVYANINVTENIIVEINEMDLGKLPLGTDYSGLGLPSTAGVTTQTGAVYYLPVSWNVYDYDSSIEGLHTIEGTINLESGFVLAEGLENKATITFELSARMYGTADIVFLIDTTGSMWDEIQNVKNNINRFAHILEDEGVSVRWALLEYRDITCDGMESTKIIYCGSSEWYIDVISYERAIAGLTVNGGGDREETVIDAIKAATYLETRTSAKTFHIVVTDADYKNENSYGVVGMNEMIGELTTKEIVSSVVTKTRYYDVYRTLTDSTGGILANIDGNFADELLKLCDLIAEEVIYGNVESIEIETMPEQTTYNSGDYFNGRGMVVKAHYETGRERIVTGYTVTPHGALQVSDTYVEINYRGKTANVNITVEENVNAVTGITLSETEIYLKEGQSYTIIAIIEPFDAQNKNVIWHTDNPNVATVIDGVVYAEGVGQTIITAVSADGGYYATATVIVEEVEVEAQAIYTNVGAIELELGQEFAIVATVLPSQTTNKTLYWEVANSSVATVNDGIVTAVGVGQTTVSVQTSNGIKALVHIVVKGVIEPEQIILTQQTATMEIGDVLEVVATVLPENARDKSVVWQSSNEEIVTVENGVITAINGGTATVTATTSNGISSQIVVSVIIYGQLTGRVYERTASTSTLLSGVTVTITNGTYTNSVITGSDGTYTFELLPYGTYQITATKTNYVTVTQDYSLSMAIAQNENIYLVIDSSTLPGYASGKALNSSTATGISGLTVYVRRGSSNVNGTVLQTITTSSDGSYTTEGLEAGNYTLQFVDQRTSVGGSKFGTDFINVVVIGGTTVYNQNISLVNVSGLNADSLRVVLTWGSSPSDLDSHLLIDSNSDGTQDYHVYYSSKTGGNATLDVDDTSSYGPETITIDVNDNATYKYYVYNYSGGSDSTLTNSSAKIKIYIGTATVAEYEFNVPTGSGRYWDVFTYNAKTGEFIFNNTIKTNTPTIS